MGDMQTPNHSVLSMTPAEQAYTGYRDEPEISVPTSGWNFMMAPYEEEATPVERHEMMNPLEQDAHAQQRQRLNEWRQKQRDPSFKMAKKDELHVSLGIPKPIGIEIHNWVEEQDWPEGTELEPIEEYHITMLYAPEGHDHKDDPWMDHESHAVSIKGIKAFPSKERGDKNAIVLTVDSETAHTHHKELARNAEEAGIEISPYSYDDFKLHMTIAYGSLPSGLKPPKLTFETEVSSVSSPRPEEPPAKSPKADGNDDQNDQRRAHTWRIAQPRAPYEAELLKFADSWSPRDQWPNALRERSFEPSSPDCTCKDGIKLECPIHGLSPQHPEERTLEFPDPSSPVGYEYHTDAPRTWMRAETKVTGNKKLFLDDTRHPPEPQEDWDWAKDAAEAKKLAKENDYDHFSLDHDLGIVRYEDKVVINPDALSGGDFAIWLHEHRKHLPKSVNIHSHNSHGIKLMKEILEKHTDVTTDRAPDDLEEEWAREFKVHEPLEIEKEVVRLPEHTASHQLAWLPHSGQPGKGLVTPSGDVHTWPVDGEGVPHHAQYVDTHAPYQPSEGQAHFFKITPRGRLDTESYGVPPQVIHHILQTLPGLRAGEHTDWHFAADEFDTRQYQDSRQMSPMTQAPNATNPHPEKMGCTCPEGEKLTCPVHGLWPDPAQQGYDHSWSIPEGGGPVGYPESGPRNYYIKAEGSVFVCDSDKVTADCHGEEGSNSSYGPNQSDQHGLPPVGHKRNGQDKTQTDSSADKSSAAYGAYNGREGDQENSIGIDSHDPSIASCDCPACLQRREHSWHIQSPGTSSESWGGLPRAEG